VHHEKGDETKVHLDGYGPGDHVYDRLFADKERMAASRFQLARPIHLPL